MAFSNFRRGLDSRDCRLDIAFVLGDDSIPDDITLESRYRDKTCVWLEFIDIQHDKCVVTKVEKKENKTIYDIGLISNKIKAEQILKDLVKTSIIEQTKADTLIIKPESLITKTENEKIILKKQTETPDPVCIKQDSTSAEEVENKIVVTQTPRKTTKTLKIENKKINKPEEEENNTCY